MLCFCPQAEVFCAWTRPATHEMPPVSHTRVLLPAGIIVGTLIALHAGASYGIGCYAAIFLFSSAVYVWLAIEVRHAELPERVVFSLLSIALLLRATFLFTMPMGSDDVFRYLWDGKVQAAGINPYLFAPNAHELAGLRSDLLPVAVNHPEMKSVYFPLSQWVFYVSYRIAGEAMWGFKLFLLIAEALTFTALWRLTKLLDMPRTHTLLYALCPLPIIQFAFDAHLDGLGIPLLAFALLYYLSQKQARAAVLLGASLAIKPVGLLLLPFFALGTKNTSTRVWVLTLPFVPFVLQFLPYLPSSDPFEGLLTFSRHWTFNGIFFEAANLFFADNLNSRLLCAGCLAVSLLVLLWMPGNRIMRMYLATLALLLFSPVVHPWYVCWLVLFLPLVRQWSGVIFAATVSLTVLTAMEYRLGGVWEQHPLALAGEYIPVLVVLGFDMWKERRGAARA